MNKAEVEEFLNINLDEMDSFDVTQEIRKVRKTTNLSWNVQNSLILFLEKVEKEKLEEENLKSRFTEEEWADIEEMEKELANGTFNLEDDGFNSKPEIVERVGRIR